MDATEAIAEPTPGKGTTIRAEIPLGNGRTLGGAGTQRMKPLLDPNIK